MATAGLAAVVHRTRCQGAWCFAQLQCTGRVMGKFVNQSTHESSKRHNSTKRESSAAAFERLGVSSALARILASRGYSEPTPVQTRIIPRLLHPGADAIVQAPTDTQVPGEAYADVYGMLKWSGSGKTLSYIVPLIQRVVVERKGTQAVVVTPTRELAGNADNGTLFIGHSNLKVKVTCLALLAGCLSLSRWITCGVSKAAQVVDVCRWFMSNGMPYVAKVVGQLPSPRLQKSYQLRPPQIVVGTPQALLRHFEHRVLSTAHVQIMVVDEVDYCLQPTLLPSVAPLLTGRRASDSGDASVSAGLSTTSVSLPPSAAVVLVSATITPEVLELAHASLRHDTLLHQGRLSQRDEELPSAVEHVVLWDPRQNNRSVDRDEVDAAVFRRWYAMANKPTAAPMATSSAATGHYGAGNELQTSGLCQRPVQGVLVFCRDRARLHRLRVNLTRHGLYTASLDADSTKLDRRRALQRVAHGSLNILLATDMASRGLDLPRLTHVYNYDLPQSLNQYTHRAGRVGRVRPADAGHAAKPGYVVTPVHGSGARQLVAQWASPFRVSELNLRRPGGEVASAAAAAVLKAQAGPLSPSPEK